MSHLFISLVLIVSTFSKSEFYSTLREGSAAKLIELEKKLNSKGNSEYQQAYIGTINMKLSESQKTPAEKLKLFKSGKIKLENSISAEPDNIEYRFLRLIIQENAPKILKYNLQIKEDSALISNNIKSTSGELRKIIQDYAKTSKNLNI